MASLSQWTWVWASSGRYWRTGKPGELQSVTSQRVGHNWVTEQQPPIHGIFSGKNIGVGSHFLLQGIFLTQGSNPCLLHHKIFYPLSHWESLPVDEKMETATAAVQVDAVSQWCSNCSIQNSSIRSPGKLRNANSWGLRPTESETLEMGLRNLCFVNSPGNSTASSNLRITAISIRKGKEYMQFTIHCGQGHPLRGGQDEESTESFSLKENTLRTSTY